MSREIKRKCSVIIVGASYAGLAAARELGERALLIDQHEIGAIQRSACAVPLDMLNALGLRGTSLQTYPAAVVHTAYGSTRFPLDDPYCIFDHRPLCTGLFDSSGSTFHRARVTGIQGNRVETTDGTFEADLLIDASGWAGVLVTKLRPELAFSHARSFGIEADIPGTADDFHFFANSDYAPNGYGWVFPAGDELRVGVLSYSPNAELKPMLQRMLASLGYEGKPCRGGLISAFTRPGVVGSVMAVGDAAGHCLPITAEGIRFAFQSGMLAGQIARRVCDGELTREAGLHIYAQRTRQHQRRIRIMRLLQHAISRSPDAMVHALMRLLSARLISPGFLNLYRGSALEPMSSASHL